MKGLTPSTTVSAIPKYVNCCFIDSRTNYTVHYASERTIDRVRKPMKKPPRAANVEVQEEGELPKEEELKHFPVSFTLELNARKELQSYEPQ